LQKLLAGPDQLGSVGPEVFDGKADAEMWTASGFDFVAGPEEARSWFGFM
jgi:hypothetical protein